MRKYIFIGLGLVCLLIFLKYFPLDLYGFDVFDNGISVHHYTISDNTMTIPISYTFSVPYSYIIHTSCFGDSCKAKLYFILSLAMHNKVVPISQYVDKIWVTYKFYPNKCKGVPAPTVSSIRILSAQSVYNELSWTCPSQLRSIKVPLFFPFCQDHLDYKKAIKITVIFHCNNKYVNPYGYNGYSCFNGLYFYIHLHFKKVPFNGWLCIGFAALDQVNYADVCSSLIDSYVTPCIHIKLTAKMSNITITVGQGQNSVLWSVPSNTPPQPVPPPYPLLGK